MTVVRRFRVPVVAVVGVILWFASIATQAQLSPSEIFEQLENRRMERLAAVQAGAALRAFSTDGCSGGLSAGWEHLAQRFPAFDQRFGHRPPWEHCCTAHDRRYWLGDAVYGYRKRKAADEALRACVLQTGRTLRDELGGEFGVSPKKIDDAFVIAAELMFRAVRVGGGPCTEFAWRWGYGWPTCSSSPNPDAGVKAAVYLPGLRDSEFVPVGGNHFETKTVRR